MYNTYIPSVSYCRAEPSNASAAAPRPRKKGRFGVAAYTAATDEVFPVRSTKIFSVTQYAVRRSKPLRVKLASVGLQRRAGIWVIERQSKPSTLPRTLSRALNITVATVIAGQVKPIKKKKRKKEQPYSVESKYLSARDENNRLGNLSEQP